MPLHIRRGTQDDLAAIAALHERAFSETLSGQLSVASLVSYYRLLLESSGGIVLVAIGQGTVTGFAAGTANPRAFARLLRRSGAWLGLKSIHRLATRPRLWLVVAVRLCTFGHRIAPARIGAELQWLAVEAKSRSRGVGRALASAFLTACWEANARSVMLTTRPQSNQAAHRLYQQLGFTEMEKGHPRALTMYVAPCPPAHRAAGGPDSWE